MAHTINKVARLVSGLKDRGSSRHLTYAVWIRINKIGYAFFYNKENDALEVRRGSAAGVPMFVFTRATKVAAVEKFFATACQAKTKKQSKR